MAFLKGPISYIKPIFVLYITLLRSVYSSIVVHDIESGYIRRLEHDRINVHCKPVDSLDKEEITPARPPIYQTLSISPKHPSIPVPSIRYKESHNDSTNTDNDNDHISPTRTDCRPAHGDGDGNRGGNGGLTDFPSERKHSS